MGEISHREIEQYWGRKVSSRDEGRSVAVAAEKCNHSVWNGYEHSLVALAVWPRR